jgi:ribonuclease-3
MKNFEEIEKKIGESYKNKDLLVQAFCHKSYLNENPKFHLKNNERLEFLGDAVLELVVTDYLYKKYPRENEGTMTKWRAFLINTKVLAHTSEELGFKEFILLSKGELKVLNRSKQSILANIFEAVIGSLYVDRGYPACKKFIKNNLLNKLEKVLKNDLYKDFKSGLQEIVQDKEGITPSYKIIKSWGPDHLKKFIVGVYCDKRLLAEGKGSSRQEAEINAAKTAIENYKV